MNTSERAHEVADRSISEQAEAAARIVAYVRCSHVTHEQALEYVALGLSTAKTQGVIEALAPFTSPQLVQMDDRTGDGWNM